MNSALQCLNHVQPFFDYFRDTTSKSLLNDKNTGKETTSTFLVLYIKLIDSLCAAHDRHIVPIEFYMEFGRLASRFFNYHQHDSLEFLNILLDILHEDILTVSRLEQTIVSENFYGQISTVVTCKQCKKDLVTDDSFSFLPLPIPEANRGAVSSGTRSCKLDQCFQTFLQGEHIGNHGQWYCEHCHKLTDAKKTLNLKKLPPVLILQLKRFNYNLRSYAKNNTFVEYDLDNLDINEYVAQPDRDRGIRYDLIAVSNHRGNLIGGHYITYAKLPGTHDWYKYNDKWTIIENIRVARYFHTASTLADGSVLVAGGQANAATHLNSAELYNPSTGTWTITGSMNAAARSRHTASPFTNGLVLVAGGQANGATHLNSAELYNPSTGTWIITGNMNDA
ncbi:unnamed protein product [Adineta steineri]|uniref:ubiquitinyl hydrolase 1 n=1 Tax=Adineta steineri TaxID=433720 RepID=A0A813W6F4_9BILA|nr:unnamed protein product [Adineta steineri]